MFYNINMNNIIEELTKNGYECFIVGGYVRDYLLSYESKDIDICTNAKIEDIERIFKGKAPRGNAPEPSCGRDRGISQNGGGISGA